MPFLMAIGTSRAFPMPNPAWPWLSPTTTSAEKLRFLPPLTTFVTRLMAITSSFSSDGFTSRSRRTARLSRKICFDIGLELYPRFPRRVRERLDAAVILVSAAVDHHFTYAGSLGALGNDLADHFRRRDVAPTLQILLRFGVYRTGGNQRLARTVVDHLRVNVSQRTVHTQARALPHAFNPAAHPRVPALAV